MILSNVNVGVVANEVQYGFLSHEVAGRLVSVRQLPQLHVDDLAETLDLVYSYSLGALKPDSRPA